MQPPATPSSSDWYGAPSASSSAHTAHRAPTQLRSPNRKSPPPPPLNLDDCRPILPFVFTNSRASRSSSAFVFTSSRSTRAHDHDISEFLPASILPASPNSPPSPAGSTASTTRQNSTHKQRPSLTHAQLAKHSEGAIDTRTTLGPNMRAAGFVHLTQSILPSNHAMLHASQPNSPATPTISDSSGGVLTPYDPPPFPPMVFVAPSVVPTATSTWNYQREMNWNIGGSNTSAGLSTIAEVSPEYPHSVASGSKPQPTLASPAPITASRAASSVGSLTLFSSTSASQSSANMLSSFAQQKAQGRAHDPDSGLNEYPFPRTFSTQAHSRLPVVSWGSAGPSPPAVAATVSSSSSTSASRHSSRHPHRSSHHSTTHRSDMSAKDKEKERDKDKSKGKDKIKPHEAGKDKEQRTKAKQLALLPSQHTLSLTELCDVSHFSWNHQPDVFSSSGSGSSRSPSRTTTSISSGAAASSSASVSELVRRRADPHMLPHPHTHKDGPGADARRSPDSAKESSESDTVPVIVPALLLPKAHVHARELDSVDRGRDAMGKPLAGEVGRREKKHLTAVVQAHRERDRQDARHTAAERERHGLKQKRTRTAKEKSTSVFDDEEAIDIVVPSPVA